MTIGDNVILMPHALPQPMKGLAAGADELASDSTFLPLPITMRLEHRLSAAAACTSTRVHSLGKKSLYMTIMNASEPRGGRARVGKNARSFFLKTARGVARQLKNFWIPSA